MANSIKIMCSPEVDIETLGVRLLTSRAEADFVFKSPDIDMWVGEYSGKEGIIAAIREGYEVNVTLDQPQEGEVVVINTEGKGKGILRQNQVITRSELFVYKDGNWVAPEVCSLTLI